MSAAPVAETITSWYAQAARDLPWRDSGCPPWGVLVSEVMLQQTPVGRVQPVWAEWLARWPTPAALASSPAGDAVRAWGRLGYPRRALRLHAAAAAIVDRHGGEVPAAYDDLRALPGVGDYTASAVAAFAFGERVAVLDTNVRRVYARVFDGAADAPPSVTVAERRAALERVPVQGPGRYAVAVMELGALVCTARAPRCSSCPVAGECRWRALGAPPAVAPRRVQRYEGTDRQARGRLLGIVRDASAPVAAARLARGWADEAQRERAIAGLVADGLVVAAGDGTYRLPA